MSTNATNYDPSVLKRMVEEKEKEWRQLAELRAERAEGELDKVKAELRDEKEKFDKVKTDFAYNLQLLAGRDSELDTAEKTIENLQEAVFEKERESSDLRARLDSLMVEFEKERSGHADQIERQRRDCEKQIKKQSLELSAQQSALKAAKEQLENRLREVEANFGLTQRQLEDGFERELERAQKNYDAQLDEVRGHLAAADTEARLLARELELLREAERRKRAELANAEHALEASNEQIKKLEWALADKSAFDEAKVRELQQKLENSQLDREAEKAQCEQRLAQVNRDLAEKVMLLERMQRSRFDDAGEAGKKIGEMQGEIARLRAITEKQSTIEEELHAERESLLTYRMQLDQCEAQVFTLTEANTRLEATIRQIKDSAGDENLRRELQFAKEKYSRAEEQVKKLEQQNDNLKQAVRQMKTEVEGILQSGSGFPKSVNVDTRSTQTDSFSAIFIDNSYVADEQLPLNIELPGDPRIKAFVDTLVRRTSSLQHRCSELVAEGRRQQIKAESAATQLESAERDCQRLRAALEHTRYELSAERSRFDADKLAAKKQLAELEERLAEARAIADEFHAEANEANAELSELRRRLASRELAQKSASTGVGFGGQELYIQQLEDQIKDFASRAKPQDPLEANARLKRAIAIIIQLQKDRMRLLDLAARLRASGDDCRMQLEILEKKVKVDQHVSTDKASARLSRPQSQFEMLETQAYERMREKLSNEMAQQRRQSASSPASRRNSVHEDDLSTSFPNSEAIQDLFQQIDNATLMPSTELTVSGGRARMHQSPSRISSAQTRAVGTKGKSPVKGKNQNRPVARIWGPESSPPVGRANRLARTTSQKNK